MSFRSKVTWMNGKLVPTGRALLPFLTPALHYGVAVFEGIRCYSTQRGPAVFRLQEHVDRLIRSATILGFRKLPFSADQIKIAVKQTVAANQFQECYIRPLVYLAEGGWNLDIDSGTAGLGIAAWEWQDYLGADAQELGIRANTASYTRHHPNVMMTKAKVAGNYVNSLLARTESARLGFDEAILLDAQGYVAECTGENIFVVRGNQLATVPTASVLEGITRASLIDLARDRGYEVIEQPISRDQLYIADEVFVCGTAAECVALREIDFHTIGDGRTGPITRDLQQAYRLATHGQDHHSAEWLEYV